MTFFYSRSRLTIRMLWLGLLGIVFLFSPSDVLARKSSPRQQKIRQEYLNYFEKVYQFMDDNYYQPVDREQYEEFITKFDQKIYSQLRKERKSDNYVKWRSAAYLMDHLKSSEDIFSAFYPPEPAKEYEQTALGVRIDLGIEGTLKLEGFQATQVEPRSDAYEKGLRINDLILTIDSQDVTLLKEEQVKELLNPLMDSIVKIRYYSQDDRSEKSIEVSPREYFKQTVFMVPTAYPWVYCLEIRRFNQKTAEDLFRFISFFQKSGPILGLILDLRNNPGGPPLAAREISSFFLNSGDEFAYFQKKGEPKALLDVPPLPPQYHYDGPMVILINKESGSASELFSGVLQKQGRAVLMGQNSAGQVMLKSMFHMEDQSMLLLVTARGHYPDGDVFSFGGLLPDRYVEKSEEKELLNYAAKYLLYVNMKAGKI